MDPKKKTNLLQAPHLWTFTTYFAEGLPYTIIRSISSVFFRDMRVSLEAIGLTSLFGIPWVLKFIWGPQIDQFATKRRWMLLTQGLLALMVLLAAALAPLPQGVRLIALLFFAGSFVAATHDMAIDGYYLEALDAKGQAKFVGYRVMAYRIAMMTGTGVIVTIGAAANWPAAFLCAAGLLLALFAYHALWLPRVEGPGEPFGQLLRGLGKKNPLLVLCGLAGVGLALRWSFSLPWWQALREQVPLLARIRFSGWVGLGLLLSLILLALGKNRIKRRLFRDRESFYAKAFMAYMDRDRIGLALAFVILMRTGESMLTSMVSPFIVDLGIKIHYGWISGGVGLPFSIAGAMAGGWMISRYTLRETLWPFLLVQNLTNLVYMALALSLGEHLSLNRAAETLLPLGTTDLLWVAGVHAFDQFAGGLGTSVLVTFLMRTCLPEYKAAHFAVGTGLMNIGGVLSGVAGGFLAEWLGYGLFFGISFLASVPGMVLVPFIPFLESKEVPRRTLR